MSHQASMRWYAFNNNVSLRATLLRSRVTAILRYSKHAPRDQKLDVDFVYTYPTINRLAEGLITLTEAVYLKPENSESKVHVMQSVIHSYTAKLPVMCNSVLSSECSTEDRGLNEFVFLMTGSTGRLGSHLLAVLLPHTRIGRIFVLNRPSVVSSRERQRLAFEDIGLPTDLLQMPSADGLAKIVYLEGQTSEPQLGLGEESYRKVRHFN